MVDASCRCHGGGTHTTEESFRLIETARTVELMAFSPDGDPLVMVPISKSEAMRLVSLPPMMGHAFRAARDKGGRVFC